MQGGRGGEAGEGAFRGGRTKARSKEGRMQEGDEGAREGRREGEEGGMRKWAGGGGHKSG